VAAVCNCCHRILFIVNKLGQNMLLNILAKKDMKKSFLKKKYIIFAKSLGNIIHL